jgi:hypothetical protein
MSLDLGGLSAPVSKIEELAAYLQGAEIEGHAWLLMP